MSCSNIMWLVVVAEIPRCQKMITWNHERDSPSTECMIKVDARRNRLATAGLASEPKLCRPDKQARHVYVTQHAPLPPAAVWIQIYTCHYAPRQHDDALSCAALAIAYVARRKSCWASLLGLRSCNKQLLLFFDLHCSQYEFSVQSKETNLVHDIDGDLQNAGNHIMRRQCEPLSE
jgi:hypothetical protein